MVRQTHLRMMVLLTNRLGAEFEISRNIGTDLHRLRDALNELCGRARDGAELAAVLREGATAAGKLRTEARRRVPGGWRNRTRDPVLRVRGRGAALDHRQRGFRSRRRRRRLTARNLQRQQEAEFRRSLQLDDALRMRWLLGRVQEWEEEQQEEVVRRQVEALGEE